MTVKSARSQSACRLGKAKEMTAKPLGGPKWHTTHKLPIRTPKGAEPGTSRSRNMQQNTPEHDLLSQGF